MQPSDADIQRALNEQKKKELSEKFGGTFHACDPNIPPELEAEWLRSIEAFELAFASAKTTTVRAYCENPTFAPPSSILHDCDAFMALDCVMGVLERHSVLVQFPEYVPLKERYRFIVDELLDATMDDLHVDGLTQTFMYEEFHPMKEGAQANG